MPPPTFIDQLKQSKTQSSHWFYKGIYTFVTIEFCIFVEQ